MYIDHRVIIYNHPSFDIGSATDCHLGGAVMYDCIWKFVTSNNIGWLMIIMWLLDNFEKLRYRFMILEWNFYFAKINQKKYVLFAKFITGTYDNT